MSRKQTVQSKTAGFPAVLWKRLTLWVAFLGAPGAWAADSNTVASALVELERAANVAHKSKAEAWLTFGLDRVPWLQEHWLGNPVWQYLASVLYIFIAIFASKLVDIVFRKVLKQFTARTKTHLDDVVLELARGPVKVVVFVILLHVGLHVFQWPDWASGFISNGLKIVVACSLTYVIIRLIDILMGEWHRRVESGGEAVLDKQLFPVISKSLKVFVTVVAALVTSQNLGMNVTGLLASLSIGGLAIGLAAQDTLSNLFGAVAIFADKPFRVGDSVKLESVEGMVEAIGLRSTRVRNPDGHLVTIPNRTVANASITNISKRSSIRTVINLGLTYDTPPAKVERALKVLEEIYRAHPMTADVWLTFDKFADSALNLQVTHWWKATDYKAYLAGIRELNVAIKQRFDTEGIEFAFPTQTIYVKADGNQPPNGAVQTEDSRTQAGAQNP